MMRCRRCEQKAVINLRQHKLALCAAHFIDWIPEQVERAIHRYQMFTRQDRLLVAISGGKDSLSLWDILNRLGYSADGLYIDLGIDAGMGYSSHSGEFARSFAAEHHLQLKVVSTLETYGETIAELAMRTHRGHYKPCSVCGLLKRHVLNRTAREKGYDVLVTGHNLDDEASALFGNTLNWIGSYLLHQAPVLEADKPGLVKKVKPLCRIYERETAAYALLRGIDYIQDECPFSEGSITLYYKGILNKLESDRPGTKLSYYLTFLQAKRNGLFSPAADKTAENLHPCPRCGQPTSAPGMCAFCRMFTQDELSTGAQGSNEI